MTGGWIVTENVRGRLLRGELDLLKQQFHIALFGEKCHLTPRTYSYKRLRGEVPSKYGYEKGGLPLATYLKEIRQRYFTPFFPFIKYRIVCIAFCAYPPVWVFSGEVCIKSLVIYGDDGGLLCYYTASSSRIVNRNDSLTVEMSKHGIFTIN